MDLNFKNYFILRSNTIFALRPMLMLRNFSGTNRQVQVCSRTKFTSCKFRIVPELWQWRRKIYLCRGAEAKAIRLYDWGSTIFTKSLCLI